MAVPNKSVWGVVKTPEESSLADVMSEQLAHDLETSKTTPETLTSGRTTSGRTTLGGASTSRLDERTETLSLSEREANDIAEAMAASLMDANPEDLDKDENCLDDALIAAMLQFEFDRENDKSISKEEAHYNGSSKISVSYSKFKSLSSGWNYDSDDESDDDNGEGMYKRDWDEYERKDKEIGLLPKCGYRKVGDKLITKHDKEISQRSNGKRIMEFPPGIETGDGGKFGMQLSNSVYNKIRNFSVKEGKRKNRITDKEDKSTASEAVDPKTRLILYKFVNNGILDSINGIVSTGKEAVIMHGDGGPGPDYDEPMNVPKEVAIKVFKTTLNEFKNREKYIREDYRFRERFSKQNPRKVIHMWAEKEFHNLTRMSKHGLRVPDVVLLKKHVLVMSFIGRDGTPAPKLKDAKLNAAELSMIYEEIIGMMNTLYNDCHLVHADLSEYNILIHDKQTYFIDVSQAVEPNHPHGLEFLYRDCSNITDFFNHRLPKIQSAVQLFNQITGQSISEDMDITSQIEAIQEANLEDFEAVWEKSKLDAASGVKTPSKPIPGRSGKGRSGGSSSGKSPRSPRSPRSPKSPRSPRSSVGSRGSLASMTDDELKELKDSFVIVNSAAEEKSENKSDVSGEVSSKVKSTHVTFEE